MKIALNWIAQYLDRPVGAAEAAEALLNAGLPIESVTPVGGTDVLDVEVTSNRTDCLSHIGLARELAALLGRTLKTTLPTLNETGPDAATLTKVQIDDLAGCPYYSARVITGVKIGPSPAWLVERLESIGLRPVNNVVDITNFVLMEIGQPLHAFDFSGLAEKRIVVRRARAGEKMLAINASTYELFPNNLVIADAVKPVAIAGVMGGKETEVGSHTRDILLESARFEPLLTRSTARQLGLMSDASYRYERGIDPTAAEWASRRAAALICEIAGGTLAKGIVFAGTATPKKIAITLRLARIPEILGIHIPIDRTLEILAALGFSPNRSGETIECTVPSHRLDVEREIDLIEEVARVHGYKHLPVHDKVVHQVQPEPSAHRAARSARASMLESGFSEAITLSFVPRTEAEAFLPKLTGVPIGVGHRGWATEVLRPSVLPSLLTVRRTNQYAGIGDARVFEVAETFWQPGDATKNAPGQKDVLALVGNSVAEVRGALEAAVARLSSAARLQITPANFPWYAPGAAGTVELITDMQRVTLGHAGLITTSLQKYYDLRQPVAGAEVDWEALLAIFQPVRRGSPLPRFPGVDRDLSVVVEDATRWADIHAAITAAKFEHLQSVDFVGTFRNKQIGAGKKSLTLSLEFRDPAATLRSEQVDAQMAAAVKLLGEKFAAVLRA